MGGLLGGGSRTNGNSPPATSLRIQTSLNGQPIGFFHGQVRLAGNLIWYDGFTSSNGGSGKGGIFGGGKGEQVTYTADVNIALCEGPIDAVLAVWNGKTLNTLAKANVTAFLGAPGQAAWGFMTSTFPQAALGYTSLAYIGADPINLGGSPELPNLNYEARSGISSAVIETYTASSPYTFTAADFTLASSVVEQATIPAVSPYQYQAQNPFAKATSLVLIAGGNILGTSIPGSASQGVIDVNGRVFARIASGTPTTGQYKITAQGLYTFAAADAGLQITIIDLAIAPGVAYCYPTTGTLNTGSTTVTVANTANLAAGQRAIAVGIPPGVVIKSVGSGNVVLSGFPTLNGSGVSIRFVGAPLAQVLSAPATGQFSLSVQSGAYGKYTFAAGDNGKSFMIIDVPDADPSVSVVDYLTNPRYGCGFPAANIGSLATLQQYAYAAGLFISPAFTASQAANDYLKDFSTGLNGEFVWSTGLLTFVPYGDSALSGFGYTYTPPAAPLYLLDDDDLLKNEGTASVGVSAFTSDDPVVCARTRQSDAYNDVKVEYLDRGNSYNPAIAEAQDDAGINLYGLRPADSKQLHFFCMESAALMSAYLQLGRQSIRNNYTFTVPWYFILLDPMDIIAISDEGLGLVDQWVRILEITENQEDWSLTITAEEYLAGTGAAPIYVSQPKVGYAPNYEIDPGLPVAPVILCAPTQLTGGDLEIWLATSGGVNFGGADVYLSTDGGSSYQQIAGTNSATAGNCRMGVLTASFASHLDPDTSDTLAVNLTESLGALDGGTSADADAGATLALVDSELVAYSTATLTSQYNYNLASYIRRGQYGTTIAAHSTGAPFTRLDDQVFKFDYAQSLIGTTVYIKLVPFNLYGGSGPESLASATAYPFTIDGPPPPPTIGGFTVEEVDGAGLFEWTPVTGYQYNFAIGYAAVGTTGWANFTLLTTAAGNASATTHSIPPGTWEFAIVGLDPASGLVSTAPAYATATVGYPNQTKNFLIGGDFTTNPWQRATSLGIGGGVKVPNFAADRWFVWRENTALAATQSMDTTSTMPPGCTAGLKVQRNSGNTSATKLHVTQIIESIHAIGLGGGPAVLSLWVEAAANYSGGSTLTATLYTGTGIDEGAQRLTGSSGSPWTGLASTAINLGALVAGTPTQMVNIAFAVPAGTLEAAIDLSWTCSGTAGINDGITFFLAQFEKGSRTTGFEYLPAQAILAACQRYYETSYDVGSPLGTVTQSGMIWQTLANQWATSGGLCPVNVSFKTPKRVAPGGSTLGLTGVLSPSTGAFLAVDNVVIGVTTKKGNIVIGGGVGILSTTGITALYNQNAGNLAAGTDIQFHFAADAEIW